MQSTLSSPKGSIALLGTGLLGQAIAERLLQQGVTLKVWNRNPARCAGLLTQGATAIRTLGDVTDGCDAVITVLRDGPTTAACVAAMGDLQGRCVIPMGTMGVKDSQALEKQVLAQNGHYLEAPVLGSRPQALSGTLLVMAGGDPAVFDQQHALLLHLCNQPMLVGPAGSGAATKLALNQLIASLTHAFSLSLRMVQQSGVPVETFMAILRPSALYAPTFDKKLQRMLDRHYSEPNFSTALLRKDLMLFLDEATAGGLNTNGLTGLSDLLMEAKDQDLDDLDYCALHELTRSDKIHPTPRADQ